MPEGLQHGHDLVAGAFVQVAGGFVSKQDCGFLDQGPGDRDALLLSAGQLRGQVAGPVGEADVG
jgi:hypothetical protein